MKKWLYQLYQTRFVKLYVYIFGRKFFDKFNLHLFNLVIKTRGYGNFDNFTISGENEFIRQFSQTEPKFCIDIGANIGSYSRILLDNTNADVLAFEPLPDAYKKLEKIQLQYGNRFTAIEEGLSNSKQNLYLYYGSEDSQLATFSESVNEISYVGQTNQQKIEVQVDTLDNYYLSHLKDKQKFCDLVKIDTEGFEYEVLQGAEIFIAEMKPRYIQIEFNLHHLYRNHSLKLIGSLLTNYDCFQILPNKQGLILRDINSTESNIFHFSNFVFIRQESVLV